MSSSSSGGGIGSSKQRATSSLVLASSPWLQPALRAFLIGYLLDALPSIFKQVLRFSLVNAKCIARVRRRIKQEARIKEDDERAQQSHQSSSLNSAIGIVVDGSSSSRASSSPTSLYHDGVLPVLKQLPALLHTVMKTALVALGPRGTALTCSLAMAGMTILDQTITSVLNIEGALKRQAYGPRRSARAMAIGSTFLSAATSSFLALLMLQHVAVTSASSRGPFSSSSSPVPTSSTTRKSSSAASAKAVGMFNPFRRRDARDSKLQLPTPLAPGGHFLARLTTLSVPATPKDTSGSRSPDLSGAKSLSPVEGKKDPLESASAATKASSLPSSPSQSNSRVDEDGIQSTLDMASPTIDLTLFALVRAMDTLVRAAPLLVAKTKRSRKSITQPDTLKAGHRFTMPLGPAAGMRSETVRNHRRGTVAKGTVATRVFSALAGQLSYHAEGLTFVVACAVIMFSWFYAPERLPPSYVKWITNLANMDHRLLLALRSLRKGKPYNWVYGAPIDPASVDLLGSLSESLGYPYGWGDPSRIPNTNEEARRYKAEAITKARSTGTTEVDYVLEGAAGPRGRGEMAGIPCEIVHCGIGGANCYLNALYRWLRAWKVCMGIYVPVHLLPRLIFDPKQFAREPVAAISKVLKGSMRSASFLSTYIASIWYVSQGPLVRTEMVADRSFPRKGSWSALVELWPCHAYFHRSPSNIGTVVWARSLGHSCADSASSWKKNARGRRWPCTSVRGHSSRWPKSLGQAG